MVYISKACDVSGFYIVCPVYPDQIHEITQQSQCIEIGAYVFAPFYYH